MCQHIFDSVVIVLNDTIISKASYQYDMTLANKLAELPMSFLDSSSEKDIVEDAKYSCNIAVYMPFYIFGIIFDLYSFIIAYILPYYVSILCFRFYFCCFRCRESFRR